MTRQSVICIFDIGKTNKKCILFDEDYNLVYEESQQFAEITDDDGFPCEDISILTEWVRTTFHRLSAQQRFEIRAINVSAYGASLVLVDDDKKLAAPLYNYLKPYPKDLQDEFYNRYGGEICVVA